jgi:PAS domain S-box-containing protein
MRILYVEDDENDVDLAKRELRRALPDLQLTVVGTVSEAQAALESPADFDLVLADLRLPDGSGTEILHAIRQRNLPLAVIVMTGQGDEDTAVGIIKAGADDYVAKRSGYYARLPQIVQAAMDRFQVQRSRRRSPIRVLYAEHNPRDIERIREYLARHASHMRIEVVNSIRQVLEHLPLTPGDSSACDVVLLDFNLPSGNVLDLLKIIHDERRLDVPIVLVAAQGDEDIAVQALRLGAVDYIVKQGNYLLKLPVALENAHVQACLVREHTALRASEERFRRLAENAPDLIYRYAFQPERRFEYVSPAAIPITGYTPEEHYADPELGFKLVHPDDRHLLELAAAGEPALTHDMLVRWIRKDGSVAWTEQRNTLLHDANGQLLAIEGIGRDVTQSREAMAALEQRLMEIEALYNVSNALRTAQTQDEAVAILLDQTLAALQTDAAAVWLYDAPSKRLRTLAASGWCRVFEDAQLAPGEGVTGSVFLSAKPYVEYELLRNQHLAEPLKSATPPGWGAGWIPIRTSNEIVGVLFAAMRLPREVSQEQVKLLLSLTEMAGSIIQRLRLLQQAQAQAELTRQIVNTVPEGLALLDSHGRILLANPPAEVFLTELGNDPPGGQITVLGERSLHEVFTQGLSWQEVKYNGRVFLYTARPVEPNDPSTSWVLVLNDVTKESENQRYQEVQDRLATVGQLAAGLAHDFNNVLGVISVYADILLLATNHTPKQRQQLTTIVDQTHHAADLVRQVLDFSRRSVMERSKLDLFPLLNEQVKLLRHTLPENIELQLHAEDKHLLLDADPTRLRQVLMNLAINARDAMPNGGTLIFSVNRLHLPEGDKTAPPLPDMHGGEWLCLTVTDTGSGIAATHLPHIFEPFFTTKGPGQGTGLGLAQVYGIVKQHGGAINVTSTPGHGTSFIIYLPLLEVQADAPQHMETMRAEGGSECILLVEDNDDLREALAQSLASLGYNVLAAQDAIGAIQIAAETPEPIDLVLSDLVMPGWSGAELFAALRIDHPEAKLLLMTGHPINDTRMQAMQNIEHWIQKPFALALLTEKVRSLLDQ